MNKHLIGACAAALLLPSLANAQTAQAVTTQGTRMVAQQEVVSKMMATSETRITPGRPYSAEAITESLQVLADGNRISRHSVTRIYRDSEGRTRREMFGTAATP